MSKLKLTPWFPGDVKPVRRGVYQRKSQQGAYSFWDGRRWCWASATVAFATEGVQSQDQDAPWRGLASKDGK